MAGQTAGERTWTALLQTMLGFAVLVLPSFSRFSCHLRLSARPPSRIACSPVQAYQAAETCQCTTQLAPVMCTVVARHSTFIFFLKTHTNPAPRVGCPSEANIFLSIPKEQYQSHSHLAGADCGGAARVFRVEQVRQHGHAAAH